MRDPSTSVTKQTDNHIVFGVVEEDSVDLIIPPGETEEKGYSNNAKQSASSQQMLFEPEDRVSSLPTEHSSICAMSSSDDIAAMNIPDNVSDGFDALYAESTLDCTLPKSDMEHDAESSDLYAIPDKHRQHSKIKHIAVKRVQDSSPPN